MTINLIEPEMVDFDLTMGMYGLSSCYAMLDCPAKITRFHFPGDLVLEWMGDAVTHKRRFISHFKARKIDF